MIDEHEMLEGDSLMFRLKHDHNHIVDVLFVFTKS
jgi:hypothetical protein